MSGVVTEKTQCRLCDGIILAPVFELPPAPIANSFPSAPDDNATRYPLELMKCLGCEHVQLRHVVSGLFNDYKYATPVTAHQKDCADMLRHRFPKANRVLEIGCNNGALLECLMANGFNCVGIDPAAPDGNIKDCFTESTAANFRVKFDLVVANNVFAHIDDLQGVFRGIDRILAEDGAVLFEVQYLVDLIEQGGFDMIYHEHLDYHTLRPLARFLKKMGMVMTDWEYLDTHGGSIRVTARRRGEQCVLPAEPLDWGHLQWRIDTMRNKLLYLAMQNQPLACFGASAKATGLLHHLGLVPFISCCVDDTPQKQGRYLPGTGILIQPVDTLNGQTVLATAWNYIDIIKKRLPHNKIINPITCELAS